MQRAHTLLAHCMCAGDATCSQWYSLFLEERLKIIDYILQTLWPEYLFFRRQTYSRKSRRTVLYFLPLLRAFLLVFATQIRSKWFILHGKLDLIVRISPQNLLHSKEHEISWGSTAGKIVRIYGGKYRKDLRREISEGSTAGNIVSIYGGKYR